MNLKKAVRVAAAAMSLGLLCWVAATGPANAKVSAGGDLAPYLVGEFDFIRPLGDSSVNAMEHRYTIHNPTSADLRYLMAPFDDAGAPSNIAGVICWFGDLAPNGGGYLFIAATLDFPTVFFGTVKIVSLDRNGRPAVGIVGFQERFMYAGDGLLVEQDTIAWARSNLESIPRSALKGGELEKIKKACGSAASAVTAGEEPTESRRVIQTNGSVILDEER